MAEEFWEKTISGNYFEIDVFAESGLDCITTMEVAAVDLDTGEEVIIAAIDCWSVAPDFATVLDGDNPTLKIAGTTDDCCWSVSSGKKLVGTWNQSRDLLIRGRCLGLYFDCDPAPESSSSSGTFYACPCQSSESSEESSSEESSSSSEEESSSSSEGEGSSSSGEGQSSSSG